MISGGFVLGYHGCDEKTAEKLLNGEPCKPSENSYDWLGRGVYFWENDPRRAMEWARFMEKTPGFSERVKTPFVIGAVINLGFCLDLTERVSLLEIKAAYDAFKEVFELAAACTSDPMPMPENLPSRNGDPDLAKRNLDCAVINHLHSLRKANKRPPYDTVRGPFQEGGDLYPGAKIKEKTHIQIAVVNPESIIGVFRVKPELLESK